MRQSTGSLSKLFCHPHQGLWNHALIRALRKHIPTDILRKTSISTVIFLDTALLFLRVITERASLLGPFMIFKKAKLPSDFSILYLDLGTHKAGNELSFVVDHVLPQVCSDFKAFGFEASRRSFRIVTKKFTGIAHVRIKHKALVHILPDNGHIKLYKDSGSGIGNSIYRKTDKFENVKALRLSDFLKRRSLVTDNKIILLRMNIEGAEFDVIKDLVENQLADRIHGYFGMWDDVYKIDIQRDEKFRSYLTQNHIHTFPFNGRDLQKPLRKKCIKYHMHTRILLGLKKNLQ